MKKAQKNFVVAYKGARRRPTPQSNLIWGNVDLRQFTERDGETVAHNAGQFGGKPEPALHDVPQSLPLTKDLKQEKTSTLALEEQMADDMNMTEQASSESETALPKAAEPKKRGPRAKKVAPEAAIADAAIEAPAVKKTRAKRGSKAVAVEAKPSARRGGRKAKAIVASAGESATRAISPIAPAGEQMEDLLQLEQENERLRKLLAEKLRAENADLRKKLGLK